MDLSVRIDIAAEPSAVWAALVDVREWPKWTASMTSVEPLDEGPLRLGSRARVEQPGMPALVWEVTEMAEGRSFAWRAKSPGVATVGYHEVEASADGSSLVLRVEQRGWLAGLVKLVSGARTRRYVQMEADGFKACCEQAEAEAS